mmetsp:Transcript_10618/g.25561  ORF Transcript_10618/g.25561 Transcript_10618/m.25561 type:complete len:205 (+) Transcript_10618:846-1460(+)
MRDKLPSPGRIFDSTMSYSKVCLWKPEGDVAESNRLIPLPLVAVVVGLPKALPIHLPLASLDFPTSLQGSHWPPNRPCVMTEVTIFMTALLLSKSSPFHSERHSPLLSLFSSLENHSLSSEGVGDLLFANNRRRSVRFMARSRSAGLDPLGMLIGPRAVLSLRMTAVSIILPALWHAIVTRGTATATHRAKSTTNIIPRLSTTI